MSDLLRYEADMISLRLVYSTFKLFKEDRNEEIDKLLPKMGDIYELCFENIKKVTKLEDLRGVLENHPYKDLLENVYDPADTKDEMEQVEEKHDEDDKNKMKELEQKRRAEKEE